MRSAVVILIMLGLSTSLRAENLWIECASGNDQRKLYVTTDQQAGCEAFYRRFNKTRKIGAARTNQSICAKVIHKTARNLQNAGFQCHSNQSTMLVDGVVEPIKRQKIVKHTAHETLATETSAPLSLGLDELGHYHNMNGGQSWRFNEQGLQLAAGKTLALTVNMEIIRAVWRDYAGIMSHWSEFYGVPIELIMTTICVESGGNLQARNAKNYGLMQVLLTTARDSLQNPRLTKAELFQVNVAIQAGTAYIATQLKQTKYDPIKVAAAYNAGGLYRSAKNPWHLRQYGRHLDKFFVWFNQVFIFVGKQSNSSSVSYHAGFNLP